jgi:hypothetical protein
MALANVSDALARMGQRVLMIDFDLEAPGLEQFFRIDHQEARRHAGLIELLLSYKQSMSTASSVPHRLAPFRRLQERFIMPVYSQLPSGGRLDLLPAGQRDTDEQLREYALNLRKFDWHDFYFNWAGEAFFEWMRTTLVPALYDVVFVDSRTGVTEMGGICAYQLADIVVLMCASNQQNVEGTQQIVKNFMSPRVRALRAARPLQVVVVPARIEQRDPELLDQLRSRFDAAFGGYTPPALQQAGRSFWDLLIPYEPRYAFDEQVISQPERAAERRQMSTAYAGLVDVVALLADPGTGLANARPDSRAVAVGGVEPAYDLTRRFAGYDAYLASHDADQSSIEDIARLLRAAGLNVFLDTWTTVATQEWQASASAALSQTSVLVLFVGHRADGDWQPTKLQVVFQRLAARQPPVPVIYALLPGTPDGFDLAGRASLFVGTRSSVDLRPDPTSAAAIRRLTDVMHAIGQGVPPPTIDYGPPYRGLRPYEQEDANLFFGRDAEIRRVLQELEVSRLVAVVGPSGSGKSSLVRAGVLPALRRSVGRGSGSLSIRVFTPGRHPLDLLTDQLGRALPPATSPNARLLLLVDQFEELFTQCDDQAERQQFVARLLAAATDPRAQCDVLLTLRADFYGQCFTYPQFASLVSAHQLTLGPLDDDGLTQAIEAPARRVGLALEPGLVERLLNDAKGRSGALPLLQMVMSELWERRLQGWLTNAAYSAVGGLAGAIASRAEAVYTSLESPSRRVARDVLLRLIQPGEGSLDTRRRVRMHELYVRSSNKELIDEVVGSLTDAHLLTTTNDSHTNERVVEISHEALISEWPRLRGWVDEDRMKLVALHRLSDAATEWDNARRDEGRLYRGTQLDQTAEWPEDDLAQLNMLERDFLDASNALKQRETAEALKNRQNEVTLRELRDWRQATTCTFGAGVGYMLLFALLIVGKWSAISKSIDPALLALVSAAVVILGFLVGMVNGAGIALGLWLWERREINRLVLVLMGSVSGLLSLSVLVALSRGYTSRPVSLLAGACLGAGLALGAGSSRTRVRRLVCTTLGGVVAISLASWQGWLPTDYLWMPLAQGLAVGGCTGLGLYFGAGEVSRGARGDLNHGVH